MKKESQVNETKLVTKNGKKSYELIYKDKLPYNGELYVDETLYVYENGLLIKQITTNGDGDETYTLIYKDNKPYIGKSYIYDDKYQIWGLFEYNNYIQTLITSDKEQNNYSVIYKDGNMWGGEYVSYTINGSRSENPIIHRFNEGSETIITKKGTTKYEVLCKNSRRWKGKFYDSWMKEVYTYNNGIIIQTTKK